MESFGTWLEVIVSPSATAKSVSDTLKIMYRGSTVAFDMNMSMFTGGICQRQPQEARCFNILLYGVFGEGKSSFVNKCHTLLADPHLPSASFAAVGGGSRHITQKLERYHMPNCFMTVTDLWGFDFWNYVDNTLPLVLQGKLPSGWEMGEANGQRMGHLKTGEGTEFERRIHAAVLVTQYSTVEKMWKAGTKVEKMEALSASDEQQYKNLKALQSQIHNFVGLTPLVLVNGMDLTLGANWSLEDPKIEEFKARAAFVCQVQTRDVYVNENYVSLTDRSAFLDKQTLMVLSEAMSRASLVEAQAASRQQAKYEF